MTSLLMSSMVGNRTKLNVRDSVRDLHDVGRRVSERR